MTSSAKTALEEGSRILDDMDISLGLGDNEDAENSIERVSGEEIGSPQGEPREESITGNGKEKERKETGCSSVVEEMSGGHVSGGGSSSRRLGTTTTCYDTKSQLELMEDVSGTFR